MLWPLLLAVVGWVVLPMATNAQGVGSEETPRTIERTLAARSAGWVDVELLTGRLEVTGWSQNQVSLEAELGAGVDDLEIGGDDQRIVIRPRLADDRRTGSEASVDLRLRIPFASKLRIRNVEGPTRIDGSTGHLDLETVAGTIEVVGGGPREVLVTSATGNVLLAAPIHRSRIRTASGAVRIERAVDDLAVVTATGDQTILAPLVLEMRLETVTGRVSFGGDIGAKGRMSIHTHSGPTELRLAESLNAELHLRTRRGKLESVHGPEVALGEKWPDGSAMHELLWVAGAGGARVEVESLEGNILVARQQDAPAGSTAGSTE